MGLSTDTIRNAGSGAYRIECLQQKRVLDTRPLWEEVFSEDSMAFTDYYFTRKAQANTTFICRHIPTGQIVSMVHLTPYEMTLQKTAVPTFYMVGVATQKNHRHKGLMSTLLDKAFACAARLQCPFIFLMPANPAIYEPFGFSYVYSRPQYSIPEPLNRKEVYINQFPFAGIHIKRLEKEASTQALTALSDFAQKTLSAQYDYYLTRTPSYYRTLLLELYAQNGCIYTFTLHNRLEGYFLYTEEENRPFIQELLFSHELRSRIPSADYVNLFPVALPEKKPIIMARNLLPDAAPASIFAASLPVSVTDCESPPASYPSSPKITDYVNYLSAHKGFINEIV